MSKFKATITDVQQEQELSVVEFNAEGITLKMMSLDVSHNIKVGSKVILSCKATTVAIAKDLQGYLSYSNQIEMQIDSLEMGKLLSSLKLKRDDFFLESIITTSSIKRMNLNKNDKVTALIKSSDLSILELL